MPGIGVWGAFFVGYFEVFVGDYGQCRLFVVASLAKVA
jgi:hypothetical protein